MCAVTTNMETANHQAARRLRKARGSIRESFDGLATGLTFDDLIAYIERDFHAKALQDIAADLDRFHARLIGLAAGVAITVVEADRLKREP